MKVRLSFSDLQGMKKHLIKYEEDGKFSPVSL